jgi:hypothetical protein
VESVNLVMFGWRREGDVRLGRRSGPLGRLELYGRGPFGRAHASCSSSVRRDSPFACFLNRRNNTHD